MRSRTLLLPLLGWVMAVSGFASTAGYLRLSLADFTPGKSPLSLENHFLYHEGDDPAWASPSYPEGSWVARPTAYRQENVAGGLQAPLCWYRLHVDVDSSLAAVGLYLTIEQQGALEVFLNGIRVYGLGKVGSNSGNEVVRICQSFEPVRLPVNPEGSNLLAVRYSNHTSREVVRMGIQPGFRIFLLAGEASAQAMLRDRDLRTIGWSVISGLGLALTLLHLVIFLSYREGRENLYFASYAVSITLFSLLLAHTYFEGSWDLPGAIWFFASFRILLVAMALTGMRFMQSVRGMQSRLGDRKLLALFVLACLIAWLTNVQVAYVITLAACVEVIRSLWIAFRQRQERVWIIGIGFAAIFPMVTQQLAIEFGWIQPGSWQEYPPLIALFLMTLSMSAYLGSRFAAVNQSLASKITEVQRSQEALAESEARYRSMFENTVAGVGIMDDQGQIIFVNDRWVEILGLNIEEVLGQDPRKQVAPQYLDEINHRLARLYRGETIHDTLEFEVLRPDGSTRTVQVWGTSYRLESGKIHLALHSMDVTDSREAERMQREAIQLAERTARMASIGVMAGGITHEINQPLNAIMLHAETLQFMARNGKLDQTEHVTSALDHIIQGTERISSIIQHMRSFWVAPEQSQIKPVDLNDPVRHGLLLLEQRVRSHAIRLKVEVDPGPLFVCAEALQVEQIVVNLISNAVNALDKAPRSDKEISLRTALQGDRVILEIKDNGVGLPTHDLDKIFDPFYSTDKEVGGTGLGLAIVQMFVDKFKGTVQAEHNSEGGATFRVCLPRCEDNG